MESYDTEMMVIMLVVLGIFTLIGLVLAIIAIIGRWKMFTKAGESGWKAIIPIYNTYTQCKIVGVNPWWILIVFIGVIITSFVPAISILGSALSIYFNVILSVSTAKSYGREDAFAIGLIFLEPIFCLILGLGSSEYLGERPMNDPIMDLFNKKDKSIDANIKEESAKICPKCGEKVSDNDSFCINCGTNLK